MINGPLLMHTMVDDQQRLAAVRRTGLLDAPNEERFDRLTRLACRLLRVPIALVSLMDADRQFYVSAQGLPEPWAGLREAPLSHSFCRSVVTTGLPLAVADASANPRLRNNPAIQDLGVVAYLAVPLALPDGAIVGALCVVDGRPRTWDAKEQEALTDLAGAVMAEIAAGLRHQELVASDMALRDSEVRLRLALEAGQLAFWELDLVSGNVVRASLHDQIFGYAKPLPEWSYKVFLSHVLPEDRAEVDRVYEMVIRDRIDAPVECRIRRADDGEVRWIEVHGQPYRGPNGQVIRLHGVLCDITHRKQTQAALRDSEARLRSILETVPDAMVVIDEQERIESFSTAAERLFGYAAGEVIGRDVSMLMTGREHSDHPGAYGATRKSAAVTGGVLAGRRKGGSAFPVELAVGEVHADGKRLRTCFVRDLSEWQATEARLQELQAELLHVSRLSAAGEIASALAHELNQPLTAITSAIRAAQRRFASTWHGEARESTRIHEAMNLAAEQALRAGQIVRHLREFVTPGDTDLRLEDVPSLIEEAAGLALVGARERGVHVTFRFNPGLPPVVVDRIQVQQVLLNLVRNAFEAMTAEEAAGGAVSRPRELVIAATLAAPNLVVIEVADTGPGLAPEVAGRLFDSFVSTKAGGMGMGLSISRTIIEAHGGVLWAEPGPKGGAVFR
ncbi:MAG: two-component system, LuxR family, sensor kinase FixL, partial [Acetobacteraceae bacterium]|nr:two-component system, LuxR family, sensor kinase FixL [Acetobacteraceae bacterium]